MKPINTAFLTKTLLNFIANPYLNYIKKNIYKTFGDNLKQQQLLFKKMKLFLKGTQIYNDLNLSEIKNYHQFIKKIPLNSYDFYENYINKTIEGDYNQLFKGKPKYLVYSSGTTQGKSKMIPCSQKMFDYFLKMQTKNINIRALGGIPCQVYNAVNEFLKLSGKKNLNEIWPDLSLIAYSGTSIENYEYQLNEKIGKQIKYLGVYNATEGPIAIEIPDLIKNKHVFTPFCDLLIYSFTDINNKNSLPLEIDELKEGNEYSINISTMSGLLQYEMKDCIKNKNYNNKTDINI